MNVEVSFSASFFKFCQFDAKDLVVLLFSFFSKKSCVLLISKLLSQIASPNLKVVA